MQLARLYETMTTQQRQALADAAGINVRYLYQMATKRRRPSLQMVQKLIDADSRLKLKDLMAEYMG